MNKILVTGAAGFIGFHLTQRLIKEGYQVVGIDNINSYYDPNLKYARLAETGIYARTETDHSGGKNHDYKEIAFGELITSVSNNNYRFIRINLEDKSKIESLFATEKFDYVVNLAAQAGVRYSIENPEAYIQSNIIGFLNILEACRRHPVKHLVYASSSSVYGANAKIPFSETDQVDNPVSLYAATKKSNELMAHTYSHLYRIPTTGLRFFTVYGPWGRPDMAPILFASAISKGDPIKVFNNGNMERDFTYIDDIVEGIKRIMVLPPSDKHVKNRFSFLNKEEGTSEASERVKRVSAQNPTPSAHEISESTISLVPYRIFNIGNGHPVNLLSFIKTMEIAMDKKAEKIMMPIQPGDVKQTWAEVNELAAITKYKPKTNIETGIKNFTNWFKSFYS